MFLSSCWKSVMMCTAPKYSIHNWDIVAITSGGKNPAQAAHVLLLDTLTASFRSPHLSYPNIIIHTPYPCPFLSFYHHT